MFLYSHWLELPIQTRHKIANYFGIIKRGSTEVVDNRVKSDGYLIKEIETALSKEKLQAYIGLELDSLPVLWEMMVNKIEGRGAKVELQPTIIPKVEEPKVVEPITKPVNAETKTKKKKSK